MNSKIWDRVVAMIGSVFIVMIAISLVCCIGFWKDAKLANQRIERLEETYDASFSEDVAISLVKISPPANLYEKLLFCYGMELNRFSFYYQQLQDAGTEVETREEILMKIEEDSEVMRAMQSSSNEQIKAYAKIWETFDRLLEQSQVEDVSMETYLKVFDFYNLNLQKMEQDMALYQIANSFTFIAVSLFFLCGLFCLILLAEIYWKCKKRIRSENRQHDSAPE